MLKNDKSIAGYYGCNDCIHEVQRCINQTSTDTGWVCLVNAVPLRPLCLPPIPTFGDHPSPALPLLDYSSTPLPADSIAF
jgi:hypothetical protein